VRVAAQRLRLFEVPVRSICAPQLGPAHRQVVGLRYFNVYGEREQHKARMASVAFHFFNQYRGSGRVRLFEGSGGYADGEQRRDFVSVEDAVAVNLYFLDHPGKPAFSTSEPAPRKASTMSRWRRSMPAAGTPTSRS